MVGRVWEGTDVPRGLCPSHIFFIFELKKASFGASCVLFLQLINLN